MGQAKQTRFHSFKRIAIYALSAAAILCFSMLLLSRFTFKNTPGSPVLKHIDNGPGSNADKNKANAGYADDNSDKKETNLPAGTDMDNHLDALAIKGQKVAYLTFDDGPSPKTTPKILSILNSYNIKGTFFVIGKLAAANRDLIVAEKEAGETIGNHTYSHDYNYLYQNPQNLLDDISKCSETIHSILGPDYDIKYVRFPGGSFGKKLEPFRMAVSGAGYSFIDWNSLNGDAEGTNIPPDKLLDRLKQTSKGKNTLVILMHDAPAKQTTVQALPQIIEYLKSQGYIFKALG
ncbi:MAG: polysaccharide deacetylase family protein [Bacillota bacterium]|nr:polysaccharide deacetylase family protein [Bacillota bacterium]